MSGKHNANVTFTHLDELASELRLIPDGNLTREKITSLLKAKVNQKGPEPVTEITATAGSQA